MKKILLTTTIFTISLLHAQTIITSANQIPTPGDKIDYKMVDMCENISTRYQFVNPDGVGDDTAKVWDFRTFINYGTQSISYDSTEINALADTFPSATHLLHYTGKGSLDASCIQSNLPAGFEVYEITDNGGADTIYRLASASSPTSAIDLKYNDKGAPRYIFPMQLGDTWGGAYSGVTGSNFSGDSARLENSFYNAEVVSEGRIILPPLPSNPDASANAGEQFDNVVLVKIREEFTINICLVSLRY